MAAKKVKRSSSGKKEVPFRRVLRFPQVKGKIVDFVELGSSPDDYVIEIRFKDKTMLTFDIEASLSGFPELSDWKTGEYKPLKRWRPVHSKSSRVI